MVQLGSLGTLLLVGSFAVTPFALLVFRPRVMGGGFFGNLVRMGSDYWAHYLIFLVIFWEKNFVDALNDPVRGLFGDFTLVIHAVEGDAVLWVQQTFEHPVLTAVLNFNYLFSYLFLTYFSVILAAYGGDRELVDRSALSYFVIYLLAVPFYIFFNVQVTSDYIPGMKALLYHSGPNYLAFYSAADPFDNAFPSLHMGIPYGLFLLWWWTMKKRGHTMRTWAYRGFMWVMIVELFVFAFSILYLGIHWITDIPGGLLIGLLGAVITEEIHEGFFGSVYGGWARLKARVGGWFGRGGRRSGDAGGGAGGDGA